MEFALAVEEEAMLEEAYMADAEVSYQDAHGKKSGLAAASNNASRVITVPLLEGV